MTRRFWLSWPQPTTDYRPLTDPPRAGIIGWWCSGYDSDNVAILCALVQANTLRSAKAIIRQSWPEAPLKNQVWRIEDDYPTDWLPGDRFPLSGWMQSRFDAYLEAREGRNSVRQEQP